MRWNFSEQENAQTLSGMMLNFKNLLCIYSTFPKVLPNVNLFCLFSVVLSAPACLSCHRPLEVNNFWKILAKIFFQNIVKHIFSCLKHINSSNDGKVLDRSQSAHAVNCNHCIINDVDDETKKNNKNLFIKSLYVIKYIFTAAICVRENYTQRSLQACRSYKALYQLKISYSRIYNRYRGIHKRHRWDNEDRNNEKMNFKNLIHWRSQLICCKHDNSRSYDVKYLIQLIPRR